MIKKILFTAVLLVTLIITVVSCNAVEVPELKSVEVTYVYNNGDENQTEQIYRFSLSRPEDPERDGYKFVGWCTDAELQNFYNFEIAPSSDITLYAKWELDYGRLIRDIGTDAMLFNVKIHAKTKVLFTSNVSQGSGVIYKYQDGYYYVLTNYHVIAENTDAPRMYYVYDAYGNEYSAVKIAADPDYDLAVLRFEGKSAVKLAMAEIDERIPSNKEDLICLGTPGGRFNSITLGKAVRYEPAAIEDESSLSNVSFEVLWLDCYAEHGSSGGAILDAELNVVGIAFAVASDKFGNFKYSLAVPSAKVVEFLNKYGV